MPLPLEKFLSLPQSIQKSFLSYDFSVVERLMNMNGFNAEQAASFFIIHRMPEN